MKGKNKNGDTVLTAPFLIIISMAFITILTVYCINMITPFIWYQKMQVIASKYMYIVDKYGYLTINEKNQMFLDLEKEGFEKSKMIISCPASPKPYGTLIELKLEYLVYQDTPVFQGGIKILKRKIPLIIKKYSYSKI